MTNSSSQHQIQVNLTLNSNTFNTALTQIQGNVNKVFQALGTNVNKNIGASALDVAGWTKALDLVFSAGTKAFSAIASHIQTTIDLQTELIGTANQYSQILKISFNDALNLSKQSSKIFETKTAGLPFSETGSQLQKLGGQYLVNSYYNKSNPSQAIDKAADVITKLQVTLGSAISRTPRAKEGFSENLFYGNYQDIVSSEIFQVNPQIASAFRETLREQNITVTQYDLQTRAQRARFLDLFASKNATDDVVKAYDSSFQSFFERLNVTLFGQSGVFSLSRDLIPSVGNSDIFTSATNFFSVVFGKNGLFVSSLPIILGVVDPLFLGIKFIFDALTLILKPISSLLNILGFLSPAIYAVTFAFTTMFTVGLTRAIAGSIGTLLIGRGIGTLAALSPTILRGALSGGSGNLLFAMMGLPSLGGVSGVIGGLTKILGLGMGAIHGFISGIGILASMSFGEIVTGIGAIAGSVYTLTLAIITNPIGLLAAGLAALGFIIWKEWKPISEFFIGFWQELTKDLQPVADLFNAIGNIISPLVSKFSDLGNAIQKSFGNLTQQDQNIGGARSAGANYSKSLFGGLPELGSFYSKDLSNLSSMFTSHAQGNLPGLFGALINEVSQMPANAHPVIANSTEAILNTGNQNDLLRSYSNKSGTNFSPNISINVSGGGIDENKLAEIVMQALNREWQKVQNNYHF